MRRSEIDGSIKKYIAIRDEVNKHIGHKEWIVGCIRIYLRYYSDGKPPHYGIADTSGQVTAENCEKAAVILKGIEKWLANETDILPIMENISE